MVKKVFMAILTIIILIGVSGCMESKENKIEKKYLPDEKKENALAYLKEKYDEEFVAYFMSQSGWGQGHDVIYLYPENGDQEKDTFAVWGTIMDDGAYSMSDGYFGVIIRDEYEAVMTSIAKEVYKEFKLYTIFGRGSIFPDRLNKDTKISEIYSKDDYFSSETIVFVKESSANGIDEAESLKKIAEKMKDEKLVGSVTIYMVFDNKYEMTSLDTLNERHTEDFFVNDNGKYIRVISTLDIGEVKNG
ncbi:MAG: hypothetical protein PHI90_10555 [Clostridia bacterium]|nr:hypothetical protein [Clostridia bacterium]